MHPEDIDDLFRSQLGSHETPPGDDLWARLQAGPTRSARPAPAGVAPERVDQLFSQSLPTYATPPRRELWERLEDEHLRPRKRRTAAWWPLGLAAALAVLLLAGGVMLWHPLPGPTTRGTQVALAEEPGASGAQQVKHGQLGAIPAIQPKATATAQSAAASATGRRQAETAASQAARASLAKAGSAKKLGAQATRFGPAASGVSKAGLLARQPAGKQPSQQQRAAAGRPAASVAQLAWLKHHPRGTVALPYEKPADEPATSLALVPAPAPEMGPTGQPATNALVSATSLISVEVRNGGAPHGPAPVAAVAASSEASAQPGLGGRLLHQVGHLLRHERLSMAEVTGLPANLTVEASLAGRRVSKSIQL